MLPQNNNPSRTIYINPNFKGNQQVQQQAKYVTTSIPVLQPPPPHIPAHINPLFLEKQRIKRPTIHMNPKFLLKLQEQKEKPMKTKSNVPPPPPATDSVKPLNTLPEERKIICKSKNRLIREPQKPLLVKASTMQLQSQPSLVVMTKRKLIRKPMVPDPARKVNTAAAMAMATKTIQTKYKLDNRLIKKKAMSISPHSLLKIKRKSFVGRYALRRTSASLTQSPWKAGTPIKPTNIQSMNRKLQLLNINGLLYKSTRNTLQLKNVSNDKSVNVISKSKKAATSVATKPLQGGLTIFVRGTKYVMDPQKFKLTRVTNTESGSPSSSPKKSITCRRIDIGGYTYVSAPSAKNVLIRTSNHLARAYVNNAKQKSLQVLSKHLVKSNIPCPIYTRVGKCAAFERGKCSKVHCRQQVAICKKFLRGECVNSKCLLSHDVSLSKMPVCKFFLQGVCVRNDCPYLHKKLSNNAEVCIEFLRGFCQLADKCNKRHEFVCPELERTGSCASKNCLYCKSKLKREKHLEKITEKSSPASSSATNVAANECHEKSTSIRYFIGSSEEVTDCSNNKAVMTGDENKNSEEYAAAVEESTATSEESVRKRPKLGDLPAFIPL